ncbi:KdsC family phosphatase [Thermodesulfatator autotrophicus]|uniref:KdsC family phosphatase n=1 Tax=Thermodesulfatator autotrophicus TaxID=1795632 RepID=UPI0008394C4F|nr:HAD hydrolase family protein [Thermodesulfatator autotrophicus]
MISFPPEIFEKAAKIRLLLLDVDGILTDARIIVDEAGREIKHFCVRDGMGIKLLQMAGLEVGLLSSRTSKPVSHRAQELGIDMIFQGEKDKLSLYEKIKGKKALSDQNIAFMGDDWVDIPVLARVGLAITVPEAWPPVKDYAHYVTQNKGGHGAVREVCDLLLKAQGKWEEVLRCFAPSSLTRCF